MTERSAGDPSLERDAACLRWLTGRLSLRRDPFSAAARNEALQQTALRWPEEPSTLLRLAAIAHGLEAGLDERFARAPERLVRWRAREPWSLEPDEAETLRLAALVCLEQVDYRSFVPSYETPMLLRDALTDPEDLSTMAAMVRWESLMRLEVSTPDRLLLIWRTHVSSLERKGHSGWDPDEYPNTLDVRGHLQHFAAALTWAGQAQWRAHIEPVDEVFRSCTERQEVPLAFTLDAKPDGWWRYRLPAGAAGLPGWSIWPPIEPSDYVPARNGRGLRTISHVWELAERPYGLRVMTDRELALWADLCARQAEAIDGSDPGSTGGWTDTRPSQRSAVAERPSASHPPENQASTRRGRAWGAR